MKIQQIFVAALCIVLASQQVAAVLNNGKKLAETESSGSSASSISESNSSSSSSSTQVADSEAAASEQTASRREAPILGNTYGAPLPSDAFAIPADSYGPPATSNLQLPVPVYGVPTGPANSIVYPPPPADIPPPAPLVVSAVNLNTVPLETYGPPQPVYIAPATSNLPAVTSNAYIPPAVLPPKYGAPIYISRPHKPFNMPPFQTLKSPKPLYGVPTRQQFGQSKPLFVPKFQKPHYGPPKQQNYKIHHPPPTNYGVPKPSNAYGPPPDFGASLNNLKLNFNGNYNGNFNTKLNANYGPPPSFQYGPPEPIAHGPPRHGVAAPPTPPDIKYDGWKPIVGLVSRPPSDSYGVPQLEGHGDGNDLQANTDFVPPPPIHGGQSLGLTSIGSSHIAQGGLSDSYGVPLNSVTGSVSTSGGGHANEADTLSIGLSAAGIDANVQQLSVIKSIGYEVNDNGGVGISSAGGHIADGVASHTEHSATINLGGGSGAGHGFDSYAAPPASSYSPTGPYAAAHFYKPQGHSSLHGSFGSFAGSSNFHSSHGGSTRGLSLSTSGIGLIPPSGVYGVPPSGSYGTPLIAKPPPRLPPKNLYGPPLNALEINPPKKPVFFREPVPHGLIESIGKHTAQKDAHGIIDSPPSHGLGSKYIPPPVPELPLKQKPPVSSSLYSLPSASPPASFQNHNHGSHSVGLGGYSGSLTSGSSFGGGHKGTLTSYTAPLNSIGQAYSVRPSNSHLTVGLDHSHPPVTIDLTSSKGSYSNYDLSQNYNGGIESSFSGSLSLPGYPTIPTDCSLKSHSLPSLAYGVPSANSYTASLSSLTTNIGGGYHDSLPSVSYGPPDLQTAHSQKIRSEFSANSIQEQSQSKELHAKSIGENFVPGQEVVKAQSVNLDNIPVTGKLGSYTLQIQPANAIVGADGSVTQVEHTQVLNDGLLQSILAAIEQPQQKEMNVFGQSVPKFDYSDSQDAYGSIEDHQEQEPQQSQDHVVVVSPPVTEISVRNSTSSSIETRLERRKAVSLIDNNEISLYFNSNNGRQNSEGNKETKNEQNSEDPSDVRNGQQYGSFVSFKSPNGSYDYAQIRRSNGTQIVNTGEVKN